MSDTPFAQKRRHGPLLREDESLWRIIPNLYGRWKGPAALLWGLLGGVISTIAYRILLVDDVQAQGRRITALETRMSVVEKQSSAMFKGVCLQLTIEQQQLGDMQCPSHLHRKVP